MPGAHVALTGANEFWNRWRHTLGLRKGLSVVAVQETAIVAVEGEGGKELREALTALGYRIQLAHSVGGVAMLVSREPSPALLFTGAALCDGNWRDVVESVRLRKAAVPVILCATEGTAELWWDALECGVLDIATPPYTSETLRRMLQRE